MQVATVTQELDWPSKMTFCVLPCRKSWIHARTVCARLHCETISSRRCQTLVWDLVRGLRKVQQDHVCLTFIIQAFGKVTDSELELCFTRPLFPESILVLGWPFINRFALCYLTVVCRVLCVFPVCDVGVLSITWCSRTRSGWGLEAFRTLVSV